MFYKVLNDMMLSKNFKLSEFECHDGSHEVLLSHTLVLRLQSLRDLVGRPVHIVSAYRNFEHNKEVGGSPNSRHLRGEAADIKVANIAPQQLAKFAQEAGFTGIGIYMHNGDSFVHVDVRPTKSYWCDMEGTRQLQKLENLNNLPK